MASGALAWTLAAPVSAPAVDLPQAARPPSPPGIRGTAPQPAAHPAPPARIGPATGNVRRAQPAQFVQGVSGVGQGMPVGGGPGWNGGGGMPAWGIPRVIAAPVIPGGGLANVTVRTPAIRNQNLARSFFYPGPRSR
ncbi:MAG TPA: hypothetical protein P5555_10565 [Candidatus Paceibacterota bacterium]|nr:hypothetical protein [Candidatus Paceibacterota bacterium]HRZ92535.1 hypothetical protein [Candidatus Paceibacterota bacterium]